jgi:hypothetical protein
VIVAHIAGMPMEEILLLPPIIGASAGALLPRARLASRARTERVNAA